MYSAVTYHPVSYPQLSSPLRSHAAHRLLLFAGPTAEVGICTAWRSAGGDWRVPAEHAVHPQRPGAQRVRLCTAMEHFFFPSATASWEVRQVMFGCTGFIRSRKSLDNPFLNKEYPSKLVVSSRGNLSVCILFSPSGLAMSWHSLTRKFWNLAGDCSIIYDFLG